MGLKSSSISLHSFQSFSGRWGLSVREEPSAFVPLIVPHMATRSRRVCLQRILLRRLKLNHKKVKHRLSKINPALGFLLAVNKMRAKTRRSKSPASLLLIDSERRLTFLKAGPLPNPLKCKWGPRKQKAVDRLGPFENSVQFPVRCFITLFSLSDPPVDPEEK